MWFTLKYDNGTLILLDQRELPRKEIYVKCRKLSEVARAIKNMVVRGAPAIGVAAAYGVVIGAIEGRSLNFILRTLKDTRPTAVNLFWALERMKNIWEKTDGSIEELEKEAKKIEEEDLISCKNIGKNGFELLKDKKKVMTICNAGALATSGYGTALGVIRACKERGVKQEIFALETRPFLQGARLTAWELSKDKISTTILSDGMAGWAMKNLKIEAVITGADRIAKNGDTANKIGTYSLAVLAKYHNIPFYVAAPISTIDLNIPTGDKIPIEERDVKEVLFFQGKRITPSGVSARNPAFDVTPYPLITKIITDKGFYEP